MTSLTDGDPTNEASMRALQFGRVAKGVTSPARPPDAALLLWSLTLTRISRTHRSYSSYLIALQPNSSLKGEVVALYLPTGWHL